MSIPRKFGPAPLRKTHATLTELEARHTPGNAQAIYHYTRYMRTPCAECDGQGGWHGGALVCAACADDPTPPSLYSAPLRFDLHRTRA